jgi:hypothetical protein
MTKPLIVALDDEEETVLPHIPAEFRLKVVPLDHNAIENAETHFRTASLILLDQEISPNPNALSLEVRDGSGFVAPLRSWARRNNVNLAPVVIFTNRPGAFDNEVPAVGAALPLGHFQGREHRIAPTIDVEWILLKSDPDVTKKISALTRGYQFIQRQTHHNGLSLDEISRSLRLSMSIGWADRAFEDLRRSRPPVNEKASSAEDPFRGPSQLVRWLCHHALPYPGLFLSDLYAAWALGIDLPCIEALATSEPSTSWLAGIRSAMYDGALAGLFPRRWWRAGIDFSVSLLDEAAASTQSLGTAFAQLAPGISTTKMLPSSTRVVVWNQDFAEKDIVSIEDAVQLHPPGWPAEAIEPWMLKADIRGDPILEAMVDPLDRS